MRYYGFDDRDEMGRPKPKSSGGMLGMLGGMGGAGGLSAYGGESNSFGGGGADMGGQKPWSRSDGLPAWQGEERRRYNAWRSLMQDTGGRYPVSTYFSNYSYQFPDVTLRLNPYETIATPGVGAATWGAF